MKKRLDEHKAQRPHHSYINHLEFFLPLFSTVTTVDFWTPRCGNYGDPSFKLQIQQIQTILRNCLSMKKLYLNLIYSGRKEIDTLVELQGQYERDSSETRAHPRLKSLNIELVDAGYVGDSTSAYYLLRVLCKLLYFPAKTVTHFEMGFFWEASEDSDDEDVVAGLTLSAEEDQPFIWPQGEEGEESDGINRPIKKDEPFLDLRMVENLRLSLNLGELYRLLIPIFFNLDNSKINEVLLVNDRLFGNSLAKVSVVPFDEYCLLCEVELV
ncbi:hypothetical protein TWF730_006619 [Orbilia blumenaviensis]|uniref:Uncharacterized protein n=1 Tax=Orbilia blumenaviensis TaxID=1796055 RepID=A0AAV9VET2_9PEZI